jgi:hypothetical protein
MGALLVLNLSGGKDSRAMVRLVTAAVRRDNLPYPVIGEDMDLAREVYAQAGTAAGWNTLSGLDLTIRYLDRAGLLEGCAADLGRTASWEAEGGLEPVAAAPDGGFRPYVEALQAATGWTAETLLGLIQGHITERGKAWEYAAFLVDEARCERDLVAPAVLPGCVECQESQAPTEPLEVACGVQVHDGACQARHLAGCPHCRKAYRVR